MKYARKPAGAPRPLPRNVLELAELKLSYGAAVFFLPSSTTLWNCIFRGTGQTAKLPGSRSDGSV